MPVGPAVGGLHGVVYSTYTDGTPAKGWALRREGPSTMSHQQPISTFLGIAAAVVLVTNGSADIINVGPGDLWRPNKILKKSWQSTTPYGALGKRTPRRWRSLPSSVILSPYPLSRGGAGDEICRVLFCLSVG